LALDPPVLVDMEQGRKWGGSPVVADTGQHDLTTDEAKQMALDADYYVMSETFDLAPVITDKDFKLKSLAATYIYASQLQGIWRDPESKQAARDLKATGDEYIAAVKRGLGKEGTGDSQNLQVVKNSSKNYRVNPLMKPYTSVF
jgi:hypothetical protein